MKSILLLMTCTMFSSCATVGLPSADPVQGVPLTETEVMASPDPVQLKAYFALVDEDAERLLIGDFIKNHPSAADRDKIDFLLNVMRASHLTYIRNGKEYDGVNAAMWLRWKMFHPQFSNAPIRGVRDFINRVATRSVHSGQFYQVDLLNGKRIKLREALNEQLLVLNAALEVTRRQAALEAEKRLRDQKLIEEEKIRLQQKAPDAIQAPVAITPAASAR